MTAASASAPRLHLTRRGRIVFTAMAAIPLAAAVTGAMLNGGVAAASNTAGSSSFSYVTVAAGQSLWEVAEAVAPAADPRDVIADIVDLNRLSSESVQPGQRLALPAGLAAHDIRH